MTLRRHRPLVLCALLGGACASESPPGDSPSVVALDYDSGGDDFSCVEGETELPDDSTPYVPEPAYSNLAAGSLTDDGTQVILRQPGEAPSSWTAQVVVDLGSPEGRPDERTFADVTVHRNRLRIITDRTPERERNPRGFVILDAGESSIDEVELIESLQIRIDADGQATLAPAAFELALAAKGTLLDHHSPLFGVAAPAQNCVEEALIHFGSIPHDMPPINMPDMGCTDQKCVEVALGWIHTHHAVWRANQMIDFLDDVELPYRSFLWGQPGLDQNHEPIGYENGKSPSSPEYWYGAYDHERYAAVREAMQKYWKILRTAKTDDGVIKIRLRCPTKSENPGNACFTVAAEPDAHHVVKGWVNICPKAFEDDQKTVTRSVGHELLHHVFVHLDGPKALRDAITHGHGNYCTSDKKWWQPQYGEDAIRHLATYEASNGGHCKHRRKVVQTVEAHALFAFTIGHLVESGQMWWWPKLADPTPQPPDCEDDPGCLCTEIPSDSNIGPDGDGSPNHYCADHDGETTCVDTKVNAGAIVGICTRCEDERGPGCSCNDFEQPCDVGFCFGDDTAGEGAGVGKCYKDPPPSYACLADCQRLFNDEGAYCNSDHPGRARCMDSHCDPSLALACDQLGLVCRDGECVQECGYIDNELITCADLGYPSYFTCTPQFRCEPQI